MAASTAFTLALLSCLLDSRVLSIQVSQDWTSDPTNFRVYCGPMYFVGRVVGLEISFIPDSTPSIVHTIAYLDSMSTQRNAEVHPDQERKGFVASGTSGGPLQISKSGGTCKDTEGLFRCKIIYQEETKASFNVTFSEARLSPCSPGAIAAIEHDKFVCRVDPNLVAELYSLEISYLRTNNRHVLANINGFLSEAQVRHSWNVKAEGQIFPSEPARSSLNVTSLPAPTAETPVLEKSIYTCKAVYLGLSATAGIVESFADQEGPFVFF